jgi:hypothetical protein
MEGSERALAGLLRIVYVCGGAGEGEDDWQIVDESVFSPWIGGTERVRVLAGLVRIAILTRGGDWRTADELELEIPLCNIGLLFVAAALRRVITHQPSL